MTMQAQVGYGLVAPKSIQAALLDSVSAVTDGEWIYIGDFDAWTLVVTGITTATVQVWVSNVPQDSSEQSNQEIQLGANITADGLREMGATERYAWLRVKVSAHTAGSINADLNLYKQ